MNKRILLIQGIVFFLFLSCKNNTSSNLQSLLPQKINDIPIGILVDIIPDTVYASLNEDYPHTSGKYIWKYSTHVSSINKELVIEEFGAYTWYNNNWVLSTIESKPYTLKDFEEWYSCDKGILKKGVTYTDSNNWSKNDILNNEPTKDLWYYIGKDSSNNNYLGYATVITIGKIKN